MIIKYFDWAIKESGGLNWFILGNLMGIYAVYGISKIIYYLCIL